YVGTVNGLYSFKHDGKNLKLQKPLPELNYPRVSSLFSDDNNHIWIVSFDKIFNYNPEKNQLISFNETDNVLGNPFVTNAFYKNNQGQAFIGAANGICYFYPAKINHKAIVLKPKIKFLKIPEKQSAINNDYTSKFSVPYKNRSLEAEIEVPYYAKTSDIVYKYRLKSDGNWYESGNQKKIMLWELPPDDYQFQVAVSVDHKQWYLSQDVINFTINPPFWKSVWFIGFLILLGLCILYRVILNLNQKLKIEKTVTQFATSLYGKNTVEDILWDVARNCVQVLGFEDCVVYLYDKNKKTMVQTAAFGPKNPFGRQINNILRSEERRVGKEQ